MQAKDENHAGPQGEAGHMSAEFVIYSPKPEIEPLINETAVAENATIPEQIENATIPIAPAAENQTPILNSLVPDKPSPQMPGASITWTANATDADKDTILYRFFLSGPSTAGSWKAVSEWSPENTWTWATSALDAGENQVRAWVRDGKEKHAAEDSFDSEQLAYFTIARPAMNISGILYNDKNGNGASDSGEPGLSGWTVKLVKSDNSEVPTISKEDGS